ncbi:lysosomal acid phosphatase-like [Ixodes scapularis]|uniref:lysosomal acid phosphatase-like n=1 Tax=Ixodes scapularis TaxID=6945 RepID=UPI001A9ED738|nr:lysosomal acid phosphatase-like [Ixodes scapularis]
MERSLLTRFVMIAVVKPCALAPDLQGQPCSGPGAGALWGKTVFHPWIQVICILLISQDGFGDEASREKSEVHKPDLVFGLFRHGDRAPLMTYPTDTNRNSSLWELGFGELTQRGIKTMLALGKYLKKRYSELLNGDPKATYVRSSPKPRCFNSAAFVLYELYPAKAPRKFDNKKWFPFPITRVVEGHDKYTLLCLTEIQKLATKVLNTTGQSTGMSQFLIEAAQQLGLDLKAHVAAIPDALDAVLVQKENGLQVPAWFENRISTLSYISRGLYVLMAQAFIKNMGGQFLRDIASFLEEKYIHSSENLKKDHLTPGQDKSRWNAKLHLLSYHDLNIIAALMALDSTFSEKPYYGSLVTFEVRKVAEEADITVYYRNGTQEIKMFNLPGCSYPCKVKDFITLVRQRFPIDFTPEVCGYPKGYVVL